ELRVIGDLERLNGRLAAGRVTPRDLTGLAVTLERIGRLKQALATVPALALHHCGTELDDMPDVATRLSATLADDPPLNPHAGGVIRGGSHATVDELRGLSHSGKQYISQLEANERQRSGIASL